MDMKKILGIVTGVKQEAQTTQLNENIEECGMPGGMSSPSTPPVTMSVNLNAQGVDNIKELLNLMRTAESGMGHDHSPAPMGMPMPAVGLDMPIKVTKISGDEPEDDMGDEPDMKPAGSDGDRGMDQIRDLIAKADKPKEYSNSPEEAYSGVDSVTTDAGGGMQEPKDPADIRVKDPSGYDNAEEAYANEPDEKYSDHNTMIKDLSGGLNREKQQYAKAQDGDNAMAVRAESIRQALDQRYREIKEATIERTERTPQILPAGTTPPRNWRSQGPLADYAPPQEPWARLSRTPEWRQLQNNLETAMNSTDDGAIARIEKAQADIRAFLNKNGQGPR